MQCPACGGDGCEECDGRGDIIITRCPQAEIDREASTLIQVLEMCDAGYLPLTGGVLDQTTWFAAAMACYRREESFWRRWNEDRAEAKARNGR